MKLCGCKEPCFEKGECWGHLQGVMCAHMGEKVIDNKRVNVCLKDNSIVHYYGTYKEYFEEKGDAKKTVFTVESDRQGLYDIFSTLEKAQEFLADHFDYCKRLGYTCPDVYAPVEDGEYEDVFWIFLKDKPIERYAILEREVIE